MTAPALFVEDWRGDLVENTHFGHAVICDETGDIVEAWGNPDQVIYPRSSCKMVQALPLVETGAADAAGLTSEHLALACASHNGAAIHIDRVRAWLGNLGMGERDLRCGYQVPDDRAEREALIRSDTMPCQLHNNCSGKHAGFLTLNRRLGGSAEYIDPDHIIQKTVRTAFEEVTGLNSPGYGIDGCSAPNFATTLHGLARAMAGFASATQGAGARQDAKVRLRNAMMTHPDLVAGDKRACTELMQAAGGRAAIKTGADGVFTAILPGRRMGVALKIADGDTRAAECVIATLLVRLGVLDEQDAAVQRRMRPPILSRLGLPAGSVRPSAALTS